MLLVKNHTLKSTSPAYTLGGTAGHRHFSCQHWYSQENQRIVMSRGLYGLQIHFLLSADIFSYHQSLFLVNYFIRKNSNNMSTVCWTPKGHFCLLSHKNVLCMGAGQDKIREKRT